MATYEKNYTRDYSLIMEEAWYAGMTTGMHEVISSSLPDTPPTFYYLTDGVIEDWEDHSYVEELVDLVARLNREEPDRMAAILTSYEEYLQKASGAWQTALPSQAALTEYINLIVAVMPYFIAMYFLVLREENDSPNYQRAMQLRTADMFFDRCDEVIRKSIAALKPELARLAVTVKRSEVAGELPDADICAERYRHFVVIPESIYEITPLSEFVREHPEFSVAADAFSGTEESVKGQVAFRGIVRGVVRIIKRKDQVGEVRAGEILVSPMTTPDYLPAMQKAAAFVTDEGGITCHAAIVARELKKPCVIGTKTASSVFQDGDMVEVDAIRGVVTKL